MRGDIASYFSSREPEFAEEIAGLPVGVDGLVSLADGFATQIVEAQYPPPKNVRNSAETNPHVCHSHDFCDANEAMSEAWKSFGLPDIDADDENQAELWNAA